ncbi:MAG: hypothetical protein PF542_01245 [Nanoarchaeota archaeon]|jgi:hypothetical protein|nr:hypothetical protein [Nanoarchaeota archaeon]
MFDLKLWSDEVWNSLSIAPEIREAKDLTRRVILSPGFKEINHRIDLENLRNYITEDCFHKGMQKG